MSHSRESMVTQLNEQLGNLVNIVEIAVKENRSGPARTAETTLAGLLNRIYDWELVNANTLRQNYPGIDLIDTKREIAVQVTAKRTVDKVRTTLEKTAKLDVSIKRLIILIITNDPITQGMKACTDPGYNGKMEVWNIPDLFRAAQELDTDRLADITDYLDKEQGRVKKRLTGPYLKYPKIDALNDDDFVGREAELKTIRKRFADGSRMVVLTGLGGIGKTELAARYGRDHPGTVYFVRFDRSFTRTLANMAKYIRGEDSKAERCQEEDELCEKVLKLLRESGEEDLLIIDNVDSDTVTLAQLQEDAAYAAICALPMRLLLTTRTDVSRAVKVEAMRKETLIQIFGKHKAALPEAKMKKLISAVNGHTLTVDLIARTLNGKDWQKVTAEEMLAALRNRDLHTKKYQKVATDYKQSHRDAQIYNHLSVVFNVSDMTGVCKTVMRCASLLPEMGMDSKLFGNSLTEEEQDALYRLRDRGWLEVKEGVLTIHPMIRLVCLTELESEKLDCGGFLDRLWAQYDHKNYQPARYSQMAELFVMAHDYLSNSDGRWLNRSGMLWNILEQHETICDLYKSRLPALEKASPNGSAELAEAYRRYGIALGGVGRYGPSQVYVQKALDICRNVFREDAPELARFYNSMGICCGNVGDKQKELEYKLKALELQKAVLPAYHPNLASAYSNVGNAYSNMGKHQEALECGLRALKIREAVFPPEHPELAASYNNVGTIYRDLGDSREALKYEQRALEIRKAVLPADHSDLAMSYYNLAWTYWSLHKFKSAAKNMRRAADIVSCSALPVDHPLREAYPYYAERFEERAKQQEKRARLRKLRWKKYPFGKR